MTTTPEYPYEPTTYPPAPATQVAPVAPAEPAPALVPTTALEALTAAPEAPVEDKPEKPNLAEITETLNGFDQIAIRSRFHERFDQLAEDPLMLARALYFVHLRRESFAAGNGHRDAEMFEAAMSVPMGEMNEMFEGGEAADEFEGDETAIAERDRQFADFVIGTGLNYTVEQYMELTIQQRTRLIEAANKR